MDSFAGTSPHRPLSPTDPSQIRLIRLYASGSQDPVRCELHHVSLDKNPRPLFTTLSYTWGDPLVTAPILLDGEPFQVTTNLRSFLQHMQTILLAIAKFVPTTARAPGPFYMRLRFFVLRNILLRLDFPRDFPTTRNAELSRLVKQYVKDWLLQQGWPPGSLMKNLARRRVEADTWAPRECYMDLWIDALCINQCDLRERSSQVARMKDIYASAAFLAIWLGDALAAPTQESQNVDDALDLIHELYSASKAPGFADRTVSRQDALAKRGAMQQLASLLRQPWFSRLWIIQEVAASASPVFLFRYTPIPLNFLTRTVIMHCIQLQELLPGPQLEWWNASRNLMLLYRLAATRQKALAQAKAAAPAAAAAGAAAEDTNVSTALLGLLRLAQARFKATDPRDYLYALLGLLGTDDIPRDLRPDYSLPFEHVFHKFTIYLIKGTNTISFLYCSGMYKLAGVPSWVPDWRHCAMDRLSNEAGTANWWDSLGMSEIKVSKYGLRLRVEGVRLGEAAQIVFPTLTGIAHEIPDDHFGNLLLAIVKETRHVKKLILDSWLALRPDDPSDAFERHWEGFVPAPAPECLRVLFEMVDGKREAELAALAALAAEPESLSPIPLELLRSFRESFALWFEHGIAVFDRGQVATALRWGEAIRAGDVLCAIKGVQAPCVLRPRGGEYSFVSVCGNPILPGGVQGGEAFSLASVERFVLV
ncbi:heterokaryon incompatibility protein-domain-containing protein [Podospora appendiculata]|uniref:Heterokaryon incompatibility protein-domain-containing protein n=1 Tax=Podospora appendiculata TaxID=314037 RepID=A0AAE0XFQ1_9PEZI|nr:heterokaryon incompatibility protein-domain-containing protein [Podospora appendiculata]